MTKGGLVAMTYYQGEEKVTLKRQQVERAIALAMQSRWQEAVAANRALLEVFPTDVDSCNRLGKALTELGHYEEARDAYRRALEIDPNSSIAKKNLDRLGRLKPSVSQDRRTMTAKLDPRLFIEETGKTVVTVLHQPAGKEVLAKVNPGDPVHLQTKGRTLVVENLGGEYIGQVEPRLGLRLITLMEGGNRYAAALTSIGDSGGKMIIREVFRAPGMEGRPSFPFRTTQGFRPYIKEGFLKYDLDEALEEGDEPSEWEEEPTLREDSGFYEETLGPKLEEGGLEEEQEE